MNWIAQIFGALAITCSLFIYSRNKKKKLLIFKCIQDICWFIHYLILSAFSAAATSMLSIARSAAFYVTPRKKTKNQLILVIFLVLYVISAILTWKNIFSLFPTISSSVSTVAFWMKMLAILASLCTLFYNITVAHSISVYVGVLFTIITSITSLLIKKDTKTDTSKC